MFAELEAGDPRQVGRYRIEARLGAGGMGRVFLARSPGGRTLAVKVLRAELAEDAGFRRRFAREVAAARRVTGVFTAAVVDADLEGTPAWLATEYVPGLPLGRAVAEHGAWPEPAVLALGAGLAEALEAIHAAGIVHRDLKPSNILLAPDGPRVIDFGISVSDDDGALTQTGVVVGTPGFMSPEQLATGGRVGPATDVFALGAVLAFAASGSGPFGSGAGHALSYRIVHEEPDLGALPAGVRAVVARCLAKDPGQRPTVAALLEELGRALGDGERGPGHGRLPDAVAAALRERPGVPPAPPLPTGAPDPHGPTHGGSTAGATPVHPPTALSAPAPPAPPTTPPAAPRPGDTPPGRSRRQLLVAAAALGAGGVGFAGWRLLGGGTDAPSSGGPATGGPAAPGHNRDGDAPSGAGVAGGTQRWSVPEFATTSVPAHTDGTLYAALIAADEPPALHALDTATGEARWRTPLPEGSWFPTPVVAGATVYVSTYGSGLHALNTTSGERLWEFPLPEGQGASSPAFADGTVYVGGANGRLYAVDADTGRERWLYHYSRNGIGGNIPAPVVADGLVHIGGGEGELFAVDADTGQERWVRPAASDWPVLHSVAVADGTVYFVDSSGTLRALDAAGGEERWAVPFDAAPSRPEVLDGTIYIHDLSDALYALDAADGRQRWSFPLGGWVQGNPSVAHGTVCFGGAEGKVYAVDAATGDERWAFDVREPGADSRMVKAPPLIAGDTVFFTAADDTRIELPILYAVAL
ncbi:serine/threonine-protein kinase [Streptomyces xiamenensis]|uniref:serine/threonine-protein kinase n=1 Tax=Streptomyces xiamenensis TaxID=408015 RepID=UPI0037D5C0C2